MSKIIDERVELLFLYDIQNANPNGDPNDENRPRLDEETGRNLVTDVRLKRTIRDYLYQNGNEIFVRDDTLADGTIPSGKMRGADFGKTRADVSKNVREQCVDVRMFGATIPMDKDSVTFTGAVQFKMGKSLHRVKTMHIKGTGAFASNEQDKKNKTFREEYILPYSFIAFHGIVNENAAKTTQMTEDDLQLLIKGIWNGTKELISRSKFGQMPRLLLAIHYEPNFFIGDLDNKLSLKHALRDEELRSIADFSIDITELDKALKANAEKVKKVEVIAESGLKFVNNGEDFDIEKLEKYNALTV